MQHMCGNILYMFDYWADPVLHILLQKSSTDKDIVLFNFIFPRHTLSATTVIWTLQGFELESR